MSKIADVINQLRACNASHVRAVIEPDDLVVLLDHLDNPPKAEAVAEVAVEAAEEAPANPDHGFEQVVDIDPEPIVNDADQSVATIAKSEPEPPKQGKLPEDFPGHAALAEAGINTFAQARKQRDSKDGLTGVAGIGEATAAKIEEALA